MPRHGNPRRRPESIIIAAALATLVQFPQPAAAGPFENMAGQWRGNGTVTYASGARERLRCRAQYVQQNDDNLQQALRCATDTYSFEINTFLLHENGRVRGHWEELVREISGSVSGTVRGGAIAGKLHILDYEAELSIVSTSNRQTVRIITPDQDVNRVEIVIQRRSR